jgi:hypothetical protein
MYGKVIVDKQEGDGPDVDIGKDFLENLPTGNHATLGSMYFNLPKFEVLYDEFTKTIKLKKKRILNIRKEDVMGCNLMPITIKLKEKKQ